MLKAVFFSRMPLWLSMGGHLLMGWLLVSIVYGVYIRLGMWSILLMLLGGLFYTIGASYS